jgi:hypothetical protein
MHYRHLQLMAMSRLMRLLLDKGANVNAQGGEYGNALQAAAAMRRGNEQILRLLLEKELMLRHEEESTVRHYRQLPRHLLLITMSKFWFYC